MAGVELNFEYGIANMAFYFIAVCLFQPGQA